MSSFNQATVCGNVGKDPEIRRTEKGDPVASFSVATSDTWTDKNSGEKMERTEWHRISCFNEGLCTIIEKYVEKGSKVLIVGENRTRKWTDKDGIERYSTEIVIPRFGGTLKLMGKPTGGTRSEDEYGTTRTKESSASSDERSSGTADDYREKQTGGGRASGYGDDEDSIPFAPEWR